jgi:hypothetical protein
MMLWSITPKKPSIVVMPKEIPVVLLFQYGPPARPQTMWSTLILSHPFELQVPAALITAGTVPVAGGRMVIPEILTSGQTPGAEHPGRLLISNKKVEVSLSVTVSEPEPGPMMLIALLMVIPVVNDTEPEPTVTLIVSPAVALVTQVWMLAGSGVEVHVGLLPEQAARSNKGNSSRIGSRSSFLT